MCKYPIALGGALTILLLVIVLAVVMAIRGRSRELPSPSDGELAKQETVSSTEPLPDRKPSSNPEQVELTNGAGPVPGTDVAGGEPTADANPSELVNSAASPLIGERTDEQAGGDDMAPSTPVARAPVAGSSGREARPSRDLAGKVPAPDSSTSAGSRLRIGNRPPGSQLRSGQSNLYTDEHCYTLLQKFGVRIPVGVTAIEVNGEKLLVTEIEGLHLVRGPYLLLPRGEHSIRFQPGGQPQLVKIEEHFGDEYARMREFFGVEGSLRTDWLAERGARAYDVHRTPFLLNLQGAGYAAEGQWDAAERKFRRALAVTPSFSPAHLNLAHCLAKRGDSEGAARELRLANAFNVGNVYGLQAAIVAEGPREWLSTGDAVAGPIALNLAAYVSSETMSDVDRRMVALLQGLAKYAVEASQRTKILNNLAVHFAESRRVELALEYYRDALLAARSARERVELASVILAHMESACRSAGFAEADEYAAMRRNLL